LNVKIFSIFSKDYSDSQLIEMIVKGKNSREMAWEFIYKKIKLDSQDIKKTWKMRQEKLSKQYNTRISEVIKVKA